MDPVLKRLQERNLAHKKLLLKQRINELRLIPPALFLFAGYLGAYYFLLGYEGSLFGEKWYGMSKQVWFLAMITLSGVGSLFLSGSLAFVIWSHIYIKTLGYTVAPGRVAVVSSVFLIISFLFMLAGKWLHVAVSNSANEIANFFTFGFETVPVLIEVAFTVFNTGLSVMFLCLFMMIVTFPFKAKKHAIESASSEQERDGFQHTD